jgi:multidrug transporter EmrE-like cation transporter
MNKKLIFFSLLIAGVIEVVTYMLLPKLQAVRSAHDGSLDYVWVIYLIALILVSLTLFANFFFRKMKARNMPIAIIFLVMAHVNYVVWTIECSCGNP